MRNKALVLMFFPLLFCVFASAADDDFDLNPIAQSPIVVGQNVVITVPTQGTAPQTITNPSFWTVQMTEKSDDTDPTTHAVTVVPAEAHFVKGTNEVTLLIPLSSLGNLKIPDASWGVVFNDGHFLLNAGQLDHGKSGLQSAKSRDDADLYGNFSFLTGVGTSPIWTIDVKGGYATAIKDVRGGFLIDVQTNTDTKAPVDRTQVDPDSIRAFLQLYDSTKLKHKKRTRPGVVPRVNSRYWELRPAGGEFDRTLETGNFVGTGIWKYNIDFARFDPASAEVVAEAKKAGLETPLKVKILNFDLSPALGFEFGKNFNKPSTIFDRPVDLSHYDAIVRLTGGADANYYFFRKKIKDPDDPYVVTLSGSWIVRVPFESEPFTVSEILPDSSGTPKRQKVVTLGTNARHNIRGDFNWNVTKLVAIQIGYRYGSLPPLFQLVNHQVTVGLAFKAKFAKLHSVAE